MKIKNLQINSNIFLSPMAGITDFPFRKICADFGAGLVYTEMVSAMGLTHKSKNTEHLLFTDNKENVAVQLFGKNPEIMVEAIQSEKLSQFKMIDINMGCPVPKIVKNGEGSALMKNMDLAYKIINDCVNSTDKPISVKFRLGFNEIIALDFAKMCEQAGASLITIHGRTREQFYGGYADLTEIEKVAKVVKIPVIANGDIENYSHAKKLIKDNHFKGVAIARGALGKPWVFSSNLIINNELKINTILRHYKLLEENFSSRYINTNFKKHLVWYLSGEKNISQMKNYIFSKIDIKDALNEVINYFQINNN